MGTFQYVNIGQKCFVYYAPLVGVLYFIISFICLPIAGYTADTSQHVSACCLVFEIHRF